MSIPRQMSPDGIDKLRAAEIGGLALRGRGTHRLSVLPTNGSAPTATQQRPPTRVVDMYVDELLPRLEPGEHKSLTIKELVHRIVPASPVVRQRLASSDNQVLMVEQLVSLAGEPLFHAVGYSPVDSAEDVSAGIRALERHPRSLDMAEFFQLLFGVPLGRLTVGIGALRADLRTSRLLRLGTQNATLVREFWQYDADGRPRSYNFTQFRPDRMRLVTFRTHNAGNGAA